MIFAIHLPQFIVCIFSIYKTKHFPYTITSVSKCYLVKWIVKTLATLEMTCEICTC